MQPEFKFADIPNEGLRDQAFQSILQILYIIMDLKDKADYLFDIVMTIRESRHFRVT